MTEVSDFSRRWPAPGRRPRRHAGDGRVAGGLGRDGVHALLRLADRSADEYRAYCDFVGRLNAILKPARPDPQVLLYYPIYDLWAEYLPVAEPLQLESQSPRAQRIVRSFDQLGQTLQRNQIPFALIDHERLAAAKVAGDGSLAIGNHRFRTLLLPTDAELPPPAAKVVDQWRQKGGRVLPSPVRERGRSNHYSPRPLAGEGQGVRAHRSKTQSCSRTSASSRPSSRPINSRPAPRRSPQAISSATGAA